MWGQPGCPKRNTQQYLEEKQKRNKTAIIVVSFYMSDIWLRNFQAHKTNESQCAYLCISILVHFVYVHKSSQS